MVEKKTISFGSDLFKLVESRKDSMYSRSEVVDRDLSRYYHLVFLSQLRIYEQLTAEEIYAILATCNGVIHGRDISDGMLRRNIAEAYQYGVLDGIEGLNNVDRLLDKMADWHLIDQLAAIDLAERYWGEISKDASSISSPEDLKELLLNEYKDVLRLIL